MRNCIRYIAFAFAATLLWSCKLGGASPEDVLHQAEASLQAFDFDETRAIVEALDSNSAMSAEQLCREALIYSKLAEACDLPDDLNTAIRCYDKALALNADSVAAFTETLNVDDRSAFTMLAEIHHALKNPEPPTQLYEMEDSLVSPDNAELEELGSHSH